MSTPASLETLLQTTVLENITLDSAPQPTMSVHVLPIIWTILIIVGAVGNGLVLYIVFRFGERSVTNIYIINLALADLAFLLIVVPITAISFSMPIWGFGDGMCKFFTFTIYVSKRSLLHVKRRVSFPIVPRFLQDFVRNTIKDRS